jgi:hypothetical protein
MGQLLRVPKSLMPLAELAIFEGRAPTSSEYKTWVLGTEAVWEKGEVRIYVPAGFMTDFASIPWMFRWWQTGSVGPQRMGAYFHDWLYSSQEKYSRADADKIFRDVMEFAGGGGLRRWFRRWAMWSALRVGGWMAWRSNQAKLKELGPYWRQLTD